MKSSLATLLCNMILLLIITSCEKEVNTTFLISKNAIGKLNKTSLARDIDVIFATDSVVKDTTYTNSYNRSRKLKIYEKKGKHLLTLTPSSDSIPTIENIRIEDQRFITDSGVGFRAVLLKMLKQTTLLKK